MKLAEEVSDGGKRDVLVSEIINRGDDYQAKVQKVNEFLSETRTRKNVKYIVNGNIGLDMLNRSKLRLSRFGTIQQVKNHRETLKTWRHIEKPVNEGIPILKSDGPSFPGKTAKNSKISGNKLNTMQENPIDSIRQLKLSNPHKIILGHLNINSLRNKFESIADVIQGTFDIFLLSETKIDESFPDKQFRLNNYKIFRKDSNRYGGGIMFYVNENIRCKSLATKIDNLTETIFLEINVQSYLLLQTSKSKRRIFHQ